MLERRLEFRKSSSLNVRNVIGLVDGVQKKT